MNLPQPQLTPFFLTQLAHSCLEQYDLDVIRLDFIQHNAGGVFDLVTSDRKRYLLKLHLSVIGEIFSSPGQIQAKMTWLHLLKDVTGQIIQTPVPNRNGSFITKLRPNPTAPEIVCTLQEWVEGVHVHGNFTQDQLRKIGQTAAIMHQFSQKYQHAGMEIPHYSAEEFAQSLQSLEGSISDGLIGRDDFALIDQASSQIARFLNQPPHLPANCGPIHADFHHENILLCGDDICVIDFDGLKYAPFIFDLGVFLYHIDYQGLNARRAFLEAYQSVRTLENLPHRWIDLVITWAAIENLSFQVKIPEQKVNPLLRKNLDQLIHEFCPRLIVGEN